MSRALEPVNHSEQQVYREVGRRSIPRRMPHSARPGVAIGQKQLDTSVPGRLD